MREQERQQTTVRSLSGINLLLGLWLIIAPFILDYSGTTAALWNDVILGVGIASIAAIRVFGAFEQRWLSWTNAALGAWLIVAPFALDYTDVTAGLWNDVAVGAVVLGLAAWSAVASPEHS